MKKTSANPPIYKNSALPPARRVKDLLSRMTLEEKAAQMMCVWQKKSETLVDANGNFNLKKARAAFKKGHGLGQVGRPSDAGKRQEWARNGRADQRHPEIFHRKQPAGHSGDVSRGVPAWPCGDRRHQLSPADWFGRDVQSRTRRIALRHDRRGSARPRHASGTHAGRGRGARSALGPRRGNFW